MRERVELRQGLVPKRSDRDRCLGDKANSAGFTGVKKMFSDGRESSRKFGKSRDQNVGKKFSNSHGM